MVTVVRYSGELLHGEQELLDCVVGFLNFKKAWFNGYQRELYPLFYDARTK